MAKGNGHLAARIVVIADDPQRATLLSFWLRGQGYESIVVNTLEEALSRRDDHIMAVFYATEFSFQLSGRKLEATWVGRSPSVS